MNSTLQRLKNGIIAFQHKTYPALAEAYQKAAREPQRPHTLMITCADSRIDIESVTHASPGQLFVMRNVGNIVPAYGELLGGVSAVVEYAVSVLRVSHIVICGHSDCGAMKALRAPETTDSLPTVKNWLQNAHAARQVADSLSPSGEPAEQALNRLTECNVLLQLQHLKTHPSVAGALARGEVSLSGWVYDIGSGHVRIAEDGKSEFVPVRAEQGSTAEMRA